MPPQQPKQLPFIWIKVVPTGHWYSSHVSADQLLQGRIRSARKQDSKWYVVDIIYGSIKAEHTIDALTDTSADNKFFTLEDAQEGSRGKDDTRGYRS